MHIGYPEGYRPIVDGDKVAMVRLTVVLRNGQRMPMLVNVGIVSGLTRMIDGTTYLTPPDKSFCIQVEELPEAINDDVMEFFGSDCVGRC